MQRSALLPTGKGIAVARRFQINSRISSSKRPPVGAVRAKEDGKDLLTTITEELKGDEVKADAPARKGFGTQQPESKKKQKAKQKEQSRPFKLQAQPAQTPGQDLEANTVKFLALLFVIFFCEGIFLAIAGFLPEAADNFATTYVYPAFSPTLGLFLLISVIYGVVKVSPCSTQTSLQFITSIFPKQNNVRMLTCWFCCRHGKETHKCQRTRGLLEAVLYSSDRGGRRKHIFTHDTQPCHRRLLAMGGRGGGTQGFGKLKARSRLLRLRTWQSWISKRPGPPARGCGCCAACSRRRRRWGFRTPWRRS